MKAKSLVILNPEEADMGASPITEWRDLLFGADLVEEVIVNANGNINIFIDGRFHCLKWDEELYNQLTELLDDA